MVLGSRRRASGWAKAIMVVMALLVIPLGVEYGRQSALKQQWLSMEEEALMERATAQALKQELTERKAYVQTAGYIETAARSRLRMSRPGEVLLVLVATATPTPLPDTEVAATPTAEPSSWWDRLLKR